MNNKTRQIQADKFVALLPGSSNWIRSVALYFCLTIPFRLSVANSLFMNETTSNSPKGSGNPIIFGNDLLQIQGISTLFYSQKPTHRLERRRNFSSFVSFRKAIAPSSVLPENRFINWLNALIQHRSLCMVVIYIRPIENQKHILQVHVAKGSS